MRKSVVNQSEIAFQAYINGIIGGTISPPSYNSNANTTLANVTVYAFQQLNLGVNPNPGQTDVVLDVPPPDLIFQASNPVQYGYDSGVYECQLAATLETQIDDEMLTPGQDIHHERVEALRDCLEDWNQISGPINDPNVVANYTLSSIVFASETEELRDRRMVTILTYEIEACPQGAPV